MKAPKNKKGSKKSTAAKTAKQKKDAGRREPNPDGIPGVEAPWLRDPNQNPLLHPSLSKLQQDEAFVRRYPIAPAAHFDRDGHIWLPPTSHESVAESNGAVRENVEHRRGPKTVVNQYYFTNEAELSI